MPNRASRRDRRGLELGPQKSLVLLLRDRGEVVVEEHEFAPGRKFRFDIALPERMTAIEIEGGIFIKGHGGAHSNPRMILRDMEKYNLATALGWRVFRCEPLTRAGRPTSWGEVVRLVLDFLARQSP